MKKVILFLSCFLVASATFAQHSDLKIVFDVTSPDPKTHEAVVRHLKLMTTNYPDAQFEVVLYSKSVPMILKDKSSVSEDLTALAAKENVEFNVCAMSLKHRKLTKKDLLPNVGVVPDGILEIALKQKAGWSYIKEAHH